MDPKLFGQARIQDFYRTIAAAGIPRSHVAVHTLTNERFQYGDVEQIMEKWIKRFPDATFKTMSQEDVHPDHAILGRVLNTLHQQGKVAHKVCYISVATFFKHPPSKWNPYPKWKKEYLAQGKANEAKFLKMIDQYKIWDPKKGFFALGYHSVPGQFKFVEKPLLTGQRVYVHVAKE